MLSIRSFALIAFFGDNNLRLGARSSREFAIGHSTCVYVRGERSPYRDRTRSTTETLEIILKTVISIFSLSTYLLTIPSLYHFVLYINVSFFLSAILLLSLNFHISCGLAFNPRENWKKRTRVKKEKEKY